jgi:cobalt-zinc-cadmium efflux system outer membrane protein
MRSCCAVILFTSLLMLGCATSSPLNSQSGAINQVGSTIPNIARSSREAVETEPERLPLEVAQVTFLQDAEDEENPKLNVEISDAEKSDNPKLDQLDTDSDDEAATRGTVDFGEQLTSQFQSSLSLESIESAALNANPAIAELTAQLESLRGKHTQSGLPPNPIVGVRGNDIFEESTLGRYGVFFGREVIRGNKLQYAQSVVCAEMQVLQQQLTTMQVRLLTDVHQRYYDVLVAQEKVVLADKLVEISDNAVEVSERLFEAEEVARTAVLQAKLEQQNAKVIQLRASNEQLAARRKLAALIGEPDLPATHVSGSARKMIELDDFEFWYDELVANSPEIAALFSDVERARRELDRQRVEPIANMTWQTTLDYDTVSDNIIGGFQVGWQIPTLNKNQGAIYEAQYNVVAAERKAEKKALDLRQRLALAYELYLDAKLQIDAYDAEIIPSAQETLELFLEGYKQGETDVLQLLTVQRTYFQTNLAYLESLRQMWRQSVEVRGMLLKGSLD